MKAARGTCLGPAANQQTKSVPLKTCSVVRGKLAVVTCMSVVGGQSSPHCFQFCASTASPDFTASPDPWHAPVGQEKIPAGFDEFGWHQTALGRHECYWTTTTKKATRNPEWDEEKEFSLRPGILVWDWGCLVCFGLMPSLAFTSRMATQSITACIGSHAWHCPTC